MTQQNIKDEKRHRQKGGSYESDSILETSELYVQAGLNGSIFGQIHD